MVAAERADRGNFSVLLHSPVSRILSATWALVLSGRFAIWAQWIEREKWL
jgi:hypothetical protein